MKSSSLIGSHRDDHDRYTGGQRGRQGPRTAVADDCGAATEDRLLRHVLLDPDVWARTRDRFGLDTGPDRDECVQVEHPETRDDSGQQTVTSASLPDGSTGSDHTDRSPVGRRVSDERP
jgi:hypothetical protein